MQELRKSQKSRFQSRPGVEYELREDGVQCRRLSWVQASEGSSTLLRSKGFRDTVTLRCFHRSETSLLTSLVDSQFPVLCAPFFTSCEAMEFAVTAVGCPGRNSRRLGLGWCRCSIGETRSWLFPLSYTTVQGCLMLPKSPSSHR